MGSIYDPPKPLYGKEYNAADTAKKFGKVAAEKTMEVTRKASKQLNDFFKQKGERRRRLSEAKFEARLRAIKKTGVDPQKKEMKFL